MTQVIIQRGLSEKQYGPSTALATIFIIIVAVIATVQYMTMRKREEGFVMKRKIREKQFHLSDLFLLPIC